MITLRVIRHDRNEQLLAECQSDVIPARGEVLQLDTVEGDGTMTRMFLLGYAADCACAASGARTTATETTAISD